MGNQFDSIHTTVWSFEKTDQKPIQYKGRCIPEIPRKCIELYTLPGELMLDAFMGSGTAIAEAVRLGRNAFGIDPSSEAIKKANQRMKEYFPRKTLDNQSTKWGKYTIVQGDARAIELSDESIDFVFAHVPYWSVITYTRKEDQVEADLSRIWSIKQFHAEMLKAFQEFYRVLKWEKYCAILVGDVRQGGTKKPLGFTMLALLLQANFQFHDQFIKLSDNAISTRRPEILESATENGRSITVHEYVIVVKKTQHPNKIGILLDI
jgi:DNA modification methylase